MCGHKIGKYMTNFHPLQVFSREWNKLSSLAGKGLKYYLKIDKNSRVFS